MKKNEPMRVQDVMTPEAIVCQANDTMEHAARLLWEHDCGCLPVVDEDGVVLAMITDRDICMAAYTQGRALREIRVEHAMSKDVVCCAPKEGLVEAARRMGERGVRRLPVTDEEGRIQGLLSVNDMACACSGAGVSRAKGDPTVTPTLQALVGICRHRDAEHEASRRESRNKRTGSKEIVPADRGAQTSIHEGTEAQKEKAR